MALSESASYTEQPGGLISVPIALGIRIFDGALVGIDNSGGANDGRLINWRENTSFVDFFLGVARVTEVTGISAASGEAKVGDTLGDEECAVDISGLVLRRVAIAGIQTAPGLTIGDLVYATDENTFVSTLSPVNGSAAVGSIVRIEGGPLVPGNIADVKLFTPDEFRARADI